MEAFLHRGNNDYILSTDMEDIIVLIDGRSELLEEIGRSEEELKTYLKLHLSHMWNTPDFYESLPGHLPPDKASQARSDQIRRRIETIMNQI